MQKVLTLKLFFFKNVLQELPIRLQNSDRNTDYFFKMYLLFIVFKTYNTKKIPKFKNELY